MVNALTQHIAKGPVDCVTEKALYTLSEDWLLWQAQDFSSLVNTHFFHLAGVHQRRQVCPRTWKQPLASSAFAPVAYKAKMLP